MGTTSNRAYEYPASTANTQIWTHFQTALDDIDADVAAFLAKMRGFGIKLIQQTGQSLNSASATALTFGASSEDFHFNNGTSWHSTVSQTSRVIPDIAGYYVCRANLNMASATYTQVSNGIGVNGTRVSPQSTMRPDAATGAGSTAFIETIVHVNGTTDYIEHFGTQISSGANLTSVSSTFASTLEVVLWRRDSAF
jgi:hypothetical protein